MSKILPLCLKRTFWQNYRLHYITAKRTILTEAYLCDEAWQKRLENPILKSLKMEQYFVETDKKFATKRLVSGVDIDLFANNVQEEAELEELEHLLYRFRRTKRSIEIMDSTAYAVIRSHLQLEQYDSLSRILNDFENYGIFPDFYSYNILMSTFLKKKMFKEAANTAVLMMLQEDFRNKISCVLGLYSCQMFLDNCPLDSLMPEKVVEGEIQDNKEEDEEEVTLKRVHYLRNPWFDDHFNITNPKHLIGKTLYLIGREFDDTLGRSYQILGLVMYEKWEKAVDLLNAFSKSSDSSLATGVVEKVQSLIEEIPEDEEKSKEKLANKFDVLFQKLQSDNKIEKHQLSSLLETKLKDVLELQSQDIEEQKRLFSEWENQRKIAFDKQNIELEIEKRLKAIEEKKEYLYWKEKLLFFFENENKNLEELKKVEEIVESIKSQKAVEDAYVVPEMVKKATEKSTIYKKLARVRKL